MNTLIFVLGCISMVVVIQIIASIFLLLRIKKLENYKVEAEENINCIWRELPAQDEKSIAEAKSYTDSRFDKAIDLLKK